MVVMPIQHGLCKSRQGIDSVEFRQLQYFIAVIEEGSITAASRRIHVAQPALTRQIRLLEESLEVTLLERHARGIHPTRAGRLLYKEAQELLERRDQARSRLRALGQGVTGNVRLGITVTHLWEPHVSSLLERYRDRYPRVAFEVFPLLSGPQLERLRLGTLDAGILYLGEDEQPGLARRLIENDHLILAVPEQSRWAQSPPQRLSELEGEDFIGGFRSASPTYHDRVMGHLRRCHFRPRIAQYGADNVAMLSLVAARLGYALVPASSSWHPIPGVRFLRLPELDGCDMPLRLAWRPDNDSPALLNLIELFDAS